jgi:hypothetical protein
MRFGIPFLSRDRGEGRGIWGTIVRAGHQPAGFRGRRRRRRPDPGRRCPVSKLQLGSTTSDVSTLPHSVEGVRAWELITTSGRPGRDLTMEVIVTNAKEPATAGGHRRRSRRRQGGQDRRRQRRHDQGRLLGRRHRGRHPRRDPRHPNDLANWDLPAPSGRRSCRLLRVADGSKVYVSGEAAYTMDYANWYGGQMPLVILFVLGMSFLLLLVAFHSIVIPLKAIILNLLSAGAAFGVLVLLFQEGWFKDSPASGRTSSKPGLRP